MSRELSEAMALLNQFTRKAGAAFPGLPEVTVIFTTEKQRGAFLTQLRADMTPQEAVNTAHAPPCFEAELHGIRIRLKVRS